MELFDSHTHLDADAFAADREEVILRAREAGVTRIVTIGAGYGQDSMARALAVAEQHEGIWCSAGIHPHDAATPHDVTPLREHLQHPKVVAVGETGLDFFRDWAPADLQERWFRTQIELAHEFRKPIIIHSRAAGADCMRILREMEAEKIGGVFHCFSEDAAFAAQLSEMNFLISIPGSVTFKKAENVREVVRAVPLEQIMLETDAPFLAPEPHRGKRCESALMVHTAAMVAAVKGLTVEQVAEATTATACKFYRVT